MTQYSYMDTINMTLKVLPRETKPGEVKTYKLPPEELEKYRAMDIKPYKRPVMTDVVAMTNKKIKEDGKVKLSELQNVLGEEILKLKNGDSDKAAIQKAQTVALLAKQVINNADVIIRFDKLKASSPELTSRIEELI